MSGKKSVPRELHLDLLKEQAFLTLQREVFDMTNARNISEIFFIFLKLGLISFGGPIAHLGYFHQEFVTRRRWLDEQAYADVVALCQFLPGPASSQVGFVVGLSRGGPMGALVAWLGFTLPSALAMIGFAYGVSTLGDLTNTGWLHGLKVAAVAVVAQAVWVMGTKLCPDRRRVFLAILGAIGMLARPFAASQVLVMALGALAGWWLYRHQDTPESAECIPVSINRTVAKACLAIFSILLVGLPVLLHFYPGVALATFESFYQVGSLVFGGGHVMLPLLQERVVATGWVGSDSFLAGYGAAQALPGPLSTFAAYLGTIMYEGPFRWVGGVWCLFAIYLPSALLLLGVLPFWESLRRKAWAQAALKGTNAAVVGLLLAAFCNPVCSVGINGLHSFFLALTALGLLTIWKCPPWLVVLLSAAGGFFLL